MVLRSNITSMKRLNPRSKFIFSYTLEKKKSNCSKNDKYQLRKKVTKRKLGGGFPKVLSPMVVPLTQEQKKHWYFEKIQYSSFNSNLFLSFKTFISYLSKVILSYYFLSFIVLPKQVVFKHNSVFWISNNCNCNCFTYSVYNSVSFSWCYWYIKLINTNNFFSKIFYFSFNWLFKHESLISCDCFFFFFFFSLFKFEKSKKKRFLLFDVEFSGL